MSLSPRAVSRYADDDVEFSYPMIPLIDTHAHLYDAVFTQHQERLLERCKQNGVSAVLMPNIDMESLPKMMALTQRHPNFLYPMLGLHPCSVQEDAQAVLTTLEQRLVPGHHPFVAIGEIGLDRYWDTSHYPEQEAALKRQIGWALLHDLPLVLHCRSAMQEMIALLKACAKARPLKGVLHCFTGSVQEALSLIDLGLLLGVGGLCTFVKAELTPVLKQIPLSHWVLETDSPYLAPVPYRGQTNEPSYLPTIASKVAQVKGCSLEEVAMVTTANAKKLFGLA